MSDPVTRELTEDGQIYRVRLATPKANILDRQKILSLTQAFETARESKDVKVVVLEAEGPHFSFGASVEEHLPGQFEQMIPAFHNMFRVMLDSRVPIFAAVNGQCLGGALELVSLCHRVFASPSAKFGQPEIQLGVFAPVASVFLVERIGRGAAEDLCLSGRTILADEALRTGLIDAMVENPSDAAVEWARAHSLQRSASSLRHAVAAVRHGLDRRFRRDLADVEALYVNDLMSTGDAQEGLKAFIEKRTPQWSNQ